MQTKQINKQKILRESIPQIMHDLKEGIFQTLKETCMNENIHPILG